MYNFRRPFRLALSLALAAGLAPRVAPAQATDEAAFALDFLAALQIRTIVENREYCGFFGRDPGGKIAATRPRRGKYNTCQLGSPPPLLAVFASYHTHAGFDRDSYNEVPSTQDLRSDIASETDGYVSTPGGRLWFSDYRAKEVRQICGAGCLPQDPLYRPGKFMKVRRSYSLADLEWLMGP
jgi:hypothetical protein